MNLTIACYNLQSLCNLGKGIIYPDKDTKIQHRVNIGTASNT